MHPHATCAAQSNIHSKGFRSLQEGEVVEFDVEHGQDGRVKAVNVTGPGGGPIQVKFFLDDDDGLSPHGHQGYLQRLYNMFQRSEAHQCIRASHMGVPSAEGFRVY